jgi:chitodextrinase
VASKSLSDAYVDIATADTVVLDNLDKSAKAVNNENKLLLDLTRITNANLTANNAVLTYNASGNALIRAPENAPVQLSTVYANEDITVTSVFVDEPGGSVGVGLENFADGCQSVYARYTSTNEVRFEILATTAVSPATAVPITPAVALANRATAVAAASVLDASLEPRAAFNANIESYVQSSELVISLTRNADGYIARFTSNYGEVELRTGWPLNHTRTVPATQIRGMVMGPNLFLTDTVGVTCNLGIVRPFVFAVRSDQGFYACERIAVETSKADIDLAIVGEYNARIPVGKSKTIEGHMHSSLRISNAAGGRNLIAQMLTVVGAIIAMRPKYVCLHLGLTDCLAGIDTDSAINAYKNIVSALTTANIRVLHLPRVPSLGIEPGTMATWIASVKNTYGNSVIILGDSLPVTSEGFFPLRLGAQTIAEQLTSRMPEVNVSRQQQPLYERLCGTVRTNLTNGITLRALHTGVAATTLSINVGNWQQLTSVFVSFPANTPAGTYSASIQLRRASFKPGSVVRVQCDLPTTAGYTMRWQFLTANGPTTQTEVYVAQTNLTLQVPNGQWFVNSRYAYMYMNGYSVHLFNAAPTAT